MPIGILRDIQLWELVRFASQRDSDKDLIPTHLIIYMGVSAMKWGMLVKLDPAFLAELLFLIPVWSCFIHAESAKFPNMPGS